MTLKLSTRATLSTPARVVLSSLESTQNLVMRKDFQVQRMGEVL